MNRRKEACITALCVSIGSQLYINVLSDGFIIALAVVIFGICLHLFQDVHPLMMAGLTGICSPFFRFLVLWAATGNVDWAAAAALPDIIFYYVFGILYFLLYYRKANANKDYTSFWITLVFCDAFSNTVELSAMNGPTYINLKIIGTLLIAAVVRSTMTLMVCLAMDQYKSLLKKEEHELRYKKLMIMASVFDSEVYFMKKGIVEIEDVMKKAYQLYQQMDSDRYPPEFRPLTLDIAKDVHEIKKGYIRVIKGLQDNFLTDIKISSLHIKDLISILVTDMEELIKHKHAKIHFSAKVYSNFTVEEHYYLMSILRNLIINSIDAIPPEKEGQITLELLKIDKKFYVFRITDNGAGIRDTDLDIIFVPGYSTKFDGATGDINRGLGLTLVKDLVEEKFDGHIVVESQEGSYARFEVWIPAVKFQEV